MKLLHLLPVGVCALVVTPAHALMSINVTQDYTAVPGWVVNTFTVDSDTDLTISSAFSDLTSGGMLNVPGFYPQTRSNGPGDSYFSINDDPTTAGWLGHGDLVGGMPTPFFDENGIGMTWYNNRTSDIGDGMHLMSLTFAEDTFGSLLFFTMAGDQSMRGSFDITDGIAGLDEYNFNEAPPIIEPDPDPTPNPKPNPDPIPYPNPGGGEPIPEPVWLGLLGIAAALFVGLHRRRLRAW